MARLGTPTLTNREGRTDFDVTWHWGTERLVPGMTAVLRVKNEARSLPWVLPPLFGANDRVVLVDNQSTDGTSDVARQVAEAHGVADRLDLYDYPFDVSRCGPEHLGTPADSVHSLAYFYNWAFSKVRTTYSMKWDGDMVLTREGEATFADLSWQLQSTRAIVFIPRHPLVIESERVAYLDIGLHNAEPWIFPMGPEFTFVKAFEWELRLFPTGSPTVRVPEGLCVELKYLDSDEFDHWTDLDAFASSRRTARKRREFEVFTALAEGRHDDIEHVIRIESPSDQHVLDYVTEHWLPRAVRPITVPLDQLNATEAAATDDRMADSA